MATFKDFLRSSESKDFNDTKIIQQSGLSGDINIIAQSLLPYFRGESMNSEPAHSVIADLKTNNKKGDFLNLFEENKPIFEKLWKAKNFDELFDAICRNVIRRWAETIKESGLYGDAELIASDIPYGSVRFTKTLDNYYFAGNRKILKLLNFRDTLEFATQFVKGNIYAADYLQKIGLNTELLVERRKAFFNVILQQLDMETKGAFLANVTDNGCFYCPVSPFKFTDASAFEEYSHKLFNLGQGLFGNEPKPDEEYQKKLAEVHEYYKKYATGQWDIVRQNFDIKNIMQAVVGSCIISGKVLAVKHIIPVELKIADEYDNIHKFVFANTELLHLLSMVAQVSSSTSLVFKANSITKEICVLSDVTSPNAFNEQISSFAFLKPFNTDDARVLFSFLSVDSREFEVSESIREREKTIRKIQVFSPVTSRIVAEVKEKAAGAVAAINAEPAKKSMAQLLDESSTTFYKDFVDKCQTYIDSYTVIEKCEGDNRVCRVPVTDDFLKDKEGNYILKNGQKVVDYNYVYSIREAFWKNNTDFDIEELIAFFVAKGDNHHYKKLSQEILGVDCYTYEQQLLDDLIKRGHLCVEELEINYESKSIEKIKYSYHADYAKGNYYEKAEKFIEIELDDEGEPEEDAEPKRSPFATAIIDYFGATFGNEIIQNQQALLEAEKNKPMTFIVNEENKAELPYKLTLGADNDILWSTNKFITPQAWDEYPSSPNPRMPFTSRSKILRAFARFVSYDYKDNPALKEFKGIPNLYELFDACVVPLDAVTYQEKYILPNWTIRVKNADGEEEQKRHPIELTSYTYEVTKGKKSITIQKNLRFNKTELMKWDGDDYYVKNMSPDTGEYVPLNSRRGLPTDVEYWQYNKEDAGKAAAADWAAKMDKLLKAAVDPYNKRKSRATQVCNDVFGIFIRTSLKIKERAKLEEVWNRKFNSEIIPKHKKYPVFIQNSKYFGESDKPFRFADTQLEGARNYISRDNSITLGMEVGYGKTLVAAGSINHLFNTGEASRPLLCVPNIVYEKWKREIKGTSYFRGITPSTNIVDLGNATPSAIRKLKLFTPEEEVAMVSFKRFVKSYESFIKKLQDRRFNMDKHSAEQIMKMLGDKLPDYSLFRALLDFQEEMQFCFDYIRTAFNKKIDEIDEEIERKIEFYNNKEIPSDFTKTRVYERLVESKKKQRDKHNAELTKMVNNTVYSKSLSLIDELGVYIESVLKPNSVIICTHEALSRLKVDIRSAVEAYAITEDEFDKLSRLERNEDGEVIIGVPSDIIGSDDKTWSEIDSESIPSARTKRNIIEFFKKKASVVTSATKNKARTDLFKTAISLQRLNVDAFIVDEVHEFNNITTSARKKKIFSRETKRVSQFSYGTASIGSGTTINSSLIQYYTKNYGQRKIQSLNCLAIARYIQNKNKKSDKNNNTMLLSATPFVNSPLFQMVSVFSIMNYELLLKCGISGVFDVFNQFATEEFKLDITHQKTVGVFPTVDRYKNIYANSNLLWRFVYFKISDASVDAIRPEKYVLPDEIQDGETKSKLQSALGIDELINSYVPMNSFQLKAKEMILDYLHGEKSYDEVFNVKDRTIEREIAKQEEQEKEQEKYDEVLTESELFKLEGVALDTIIKVVDTEHYFKSILADTTNKGGWQDLGTGLPKEEEVEVEVLSDESEEEDDSEDIDVTAGDAELSLREGSFSEQDEKKAKTIMAMTADENLSTSPYMGQIIGLDLPPLVEVVGGKKKYYANNFVENSPKFLYTAGCIRSVLDYHAAKGEPASGQIVYVDRQEFAYLGDKFNPLELFKKYLVEKEDIELTESEIVIITGKTSDIIREDYMKGFNSGKYKVLLGTSAIKQGVDLQVNTSVMYLLQADYVPSNLMQIEGRGWRQGNQWKNIRIVFNLTYGSLDIFQLSKVNHKIQQIKKMLDKNIFDLNTTQFDKDYDKMKLELETDVVKKAKLMLELENQAKDYEWNNYNAMYESFVKIEKNIGKYKPMWIAYIDRLNSMGKQLEQMTIADLKVEYAELLKKRMKETQREAQRVLVEAEDERIKKENDIYKEKIKAEIEIIKGKIEAIEAQEKAAAKEVTKAAKTKKAGAADEPTVATEVAVAPEPVAAVIENKEKKALETQRDELVEKSKIKLISAEQRGELINVLTTDIRTKDEAALNAITVTDVQALDYLKEIANIPQAEMKNVPLRDLFDIVETGGTSAMFAKKKRYAHVTLTPQSSFNQVDDVVLKIKDTTRYWMQTISSFEMSSGGVKEKYKAYQDIYESVGYKKGFDMTEQMGELYGKSAQTIAKTGFDAFITDSDSFTFKTNKGSVIHAYYTQILGDDKNFKTKIKEVKDRLDALDAEIKNEIPRLKALTKQLKAEEEIKRAKGAFDLETQVKKFDLTNVLLVKKEK